MRERKGVSSDYVTARALYPVLLPLSSGGQTISSLSRAALLEALLPLTDEKLSVLASA